MKTDFYVTVLGSCAALPLHDRGCSGQVVSVRGSRVLIDCGEGTQNALRFAHAKMQSVEVVCISHMHGDHFFGLPGLLGTMHLCGRTQPLTIIGPKGIGAVLTNFMWQSGNTLRYQLDFVEIGEHDCPVGSRRLVFGSKKYNIYAMPLCHSLPTYGYVVEEVPNRDNGIFYRYAYCCDTKPFDGLVEQLSGVDLLCIESTFGNDHASLAADMSHCTAAQAADVARRLSARDGTEPLLILTHFSARYKDSVPMLVDEAAAVYPNVVAAEDGARYYVANK